MGIISGLINMISSGGNFRFIAQNMAAIYSVLQDTSFGQSLDRHHLLFATALADVQAYFWAGQMTEEDLNQAVSCALTRTVSINSYSRRSFSPSDTSDPLRGFSENMDIICLTMQVEAMIFALSSRLDSDIVVDQVIKNKKVIAKTIENGLRDIKHLRIYNAVHNNVIAWISDSEFRRTIISYKYVRSI